MIRVCGLMGLLALTGCQAPPQIPTAQCHDPAVEKTNPYFDRCAAGHTIVEALSAQYGLLPPPGRGASRI
jgi:hypothetical protein